MAVHELRQLPAICRAKGKREVRPTAVSEAKFHASWSSSALASFRSAVSSPWHVEPLGEPLVERRQQFTLGAAALIAPQPGKASCSPQCSVRHNCGQPQAATALCQGEADSPLLKAFKGAILTSKAPESGGSRSRE
jgi:hypothetical protein